MKKILICFCVSLLFTTAGISVCASGTSTPVFGGKFVNGVGNTLIYLDYSSGIGAWEGYITTAADNWMYTGWSNPIYITFVSSDNGSNIDFYAENNSYWTARGYYGVLGETAQFRNGQKVNQYSSNWTYAEIRLNDTLLRSDSVSNYNCQGTVCHEMGHAFGLAHNNSNTGSVMCQLSSGRTVNRPAQTDNDAINLLY